MVQKTGKKRKHEVIEDEEEVLEPLPLTRSSDDPIPKKSKWVNRQRVLVFAARGITVRDRHLMNDLRTLMPHSRNENKMEKKNLFVLNEIFETRHCNKGIFFEGRLRRDLYMWLVNAPNGPSAKFLIENSYTTTELKMTGNCLKGTRPLLSFDTVFDEAPHYQLLKELFIQIFGTPNGHPKSQPFFDHVLTFSIHDNRVWFRNYQILAEDGALAEVGPRFVMNPIKIFDGSFTGNTLWENPYYTTPAQRRSLLKKHSQSSKYINKVSHKLHHDLTRPSKTYGDTDGNDLFAGDSYERAQELVNESEKEKKEKQRKKPVEKEAKTLHTLQSEIKRKQTKRAQAISAQKKRLREKQRKEDIKFNGSEQLKKLDAKLKPKKKKK